MTPELREKSRANWRTCNVYVIDIAVSTIQFIEWNCWHGLNKWLKSVITLNVYAYRNAFNDKNDDEDDNVRAILTIERKTRWINYLYETGTCLMQCAISVAFNWVSLENWDNFRHFTNCLCRFSLHFAIKFLERKAVLWRKEPQQHWTFMWINDCKCGNQCAWVALNGWKRTSDKRFHKRTSGNQMKLE